MVYRETPRIAAQDGRLDGVVDDTGPGPRLRRFDFVRTQRQLDLPRVLLACSLSVVWISLGGLHGNAGPAVHDRLAPSATGVSGEIPRYSS